jgi:hypothetical protein
LQQKTQARAAAQDTLTKNQSRRRRSLRWARERFSQRQQRARTAATLDSFARGQTGRRSRRSPSHAQTAARSAGSVETQFGFHIIKVHERRAARTVPFAEVSGRDQAVPRAAAEGAEAGKQFVEGAKSRGENCDDAG